ncbi:hypothetical protein [Novosphingobium sp. TCA1]|uniref:hypothetical protein n=1 Tax=Novosphingobium sp. TCA1 TaxID=2682474 RepID=UPI00135B8356|nr:hypothetical protein [Novosphingobium sp. TCA1]
MPERQDPYDCGHVLLQMRKNEVVLRNVQHVGFARFSRGCGVAVIACRALLVWLILVTQERGGAIQNCAEPLWIASLRSQ